MIEAMLDLTRTHLGAAPPVRPSAGVVPGDQAPARRRARRPGAGPVGGSLRGGGLRPGPVLGRAGLGGRGRGVHRRGHPGGSRDRPAARRHRLHLGAPGPLLPSQGPGRRGRLRPGPVRTARWSRRCWASDEPTTDGGGAARGRRGASGRGARLGRARAAPAAAAAAPRGRLLGAAVPERLGQPDLPRPVRRGRPRRAAASLRRDRGRCPRHAARVHRAVAAARGVPAGPARRALLRGHGGHRRPLPGLGVPPGCRGLGPGAGGAGGRPGARAPDRLRGGRRPGGPAPGRPGRLRPRLPRPPRRLPGPTGPGLAAPLGRGRDQGPRHGRPGRRAPRPAPARVRPARAGPQRLQGRQLPVRPG